MEALIILHDNTLYYVPSIYSGEGGAHGIRKVVRMILVRLELKA